ncbi:MAG: zf-HC2 domain-containing protein [Microbacterium sp.]
MTDCGCDRARRDLEAYLRGEIASCATADNEIRAHIAGCPSCQEEVLLERTLTEAIRRACSESAPPEVREIILAQVRAAHPLTPQA